MIDSHAHVAFTQFDEDREAVVERARAAQMRWLEVGVDLNQSYKALALAEELSDDVVGATVGVHPSDISSLDDSAWHEITQLAQKPEVVAIGEVGFDFYRGGKEEEQLLWLKRFIELAREIDKPLVFHVRNGEKQDAHDSLLALLGRNNIPGGVVHTYSGTMTQAKAYLELGLYLSFSGVVTYKNARDIASVATEIPIDRILIETDCPFLTPEPNRGKRNEPSYAGLVAEKIAQLRYLPVEEMAALTEENTLRLFGV